MDTKQLKNIQSDILKEYTLDNAQTLEDEVEIITNAATKIKSINKNLTEIRTENWYKLGMLLTEHMNHVIKQKGNIWDSWATEKFYPLIKRRRRQNCMTLAKLIHKDKRIKKYYYMGMDCIIDLFYKLEDFIKFNNAEYEYAKKEFGFVFITEPQTEEEKEYLRNSANTMREFFKFIKNVNHKNYDKEQVVRVIKAGETFSKNDYEELNDTKKTNSDIKEYLRKKLSGGGAQVTTSPNQRSPESIQVILAKLIQTIDGYASSSLWPEYLEHEIVDEAIQRLLVLKKSL